MHPALTGVGQRFIGAQCRLGRQQSQCGIVDRRWFYNDLDLLNRPGPLMQRVWGRQNAGLYALPSGTGAGPAVWCHGLLPDYHAFRGSYGGYVFPLYDRRPNINDPNISASLISAGFQKVRYTMPAAFKKL